MGDVVGTVFTAIAAVTIILLLLMLWRNSTESMIGMSTAKPATGVYNSTPYYHPGSYQVSNLTPFRQPGGHLLFVSPADDPQELATLKYFDGRWYDYGGRGAYSGGDSLVWPDGTVWTGQPPPPPPVTSATAATAP
jgi:hypothetical protein